MQIGLEFTWTGEQRDKLNPKGSGRGGLTGETIGTLEGVDMKL